MRSLFWKIFLWFWATVILMGAALVITWNLQPEVVSSRWRASTGNAVSFYAQSSAEQFDRYGQNALQNYFQRLESSTRIRASLYDENGSLLAGARSPTAQSMVASTDASREPSFIITAGNAYAAQRAMGPSGQRYVFVAEMPRGPLGAFKPAAPNTIARWLLAVLISGFICYLLVLYLTRPILRLRKAAMELSAGQLSARAGPEMERRRDEIGGLVRDFNHMAERIEALLTSQRQLISDISHELRSPLARLNVALGLVRQRAPSDVEPQLDRIERETERLNELIGRLLSLARIEALTEAPERTEVDLRQLVTEIAADAAFEAGEKNCRIVTSLEPCSTSGNTELLRSAIENVVRNAVRYTGPETEVDISLRARRDGPGGGPEIVVRDHGPGVPQEELGNIFRPFYRITRARERDTGGTGLGLAITQRVVQLHRGQAFATVAEGGGLSVHIVLPRR